MVDSNFEIFYNLRNNQSPLMTKSLTQLSDFLKIDNISIFLKRSREISHKQYKVINFFRFMYNFKTYGRTFKGLAGECFFQLTRSNSYLTRFHPLDFVLRKYADILHDNQKEFLKKIGFNLMQLSFEKI